MKSKLAYSIIFSFGAGAILALMLSCRSFQENWLKIFFVVFLLLVITSLSTWFLNERKWLFWITQVLAIFISVGAFWYIIAPNYKPEANLCRGLGHYYYSFAAIYLPFLCLTSDKISGEKVCSSAKEKLGITEVNLGFFVVKLTRKSLPVVYMLSALLVARLVFQWPEKWEIPGTGIISIHYTYWPEFLCFTIGTFIFYYGANKYYS